MVSLVWIRVNDYPAVSVASGKLLLVKYGLENF
jgi:hypothetical protein